MLHIEIVATIPTICRTVVKRHPTEECLSARFVGRDARIFVSAMEPSADTTHFDTIIIMRDETSLVELFAVGLKTGAWPKEVFDLTRLHLCQADGCALPDQSCPSTQRPVGNRYVASDGRSRQPNGSILFGLMHAWGWSGITRDRKAAFEWL